LSLGVKTVKRACYVCIMLKLYSTVLLQDTAWVRGIVLLSLTRRLTLVPNEQENRSMDCVTTWSTLYLVVECDELTRKLASLATSSLPQIRNRRVRTKSRRVTLLIGWVTNICRLMKFVIPYLVARLITLGLRSEPTPTRKRLVHLCT
jgi:hypothetical protein